MSVLYNEHPNSHPYTLGEVPGDAQPIPHTHTDLWGNRFTYKPGSADSWAEKEIDHE